MIEAPLYMTAALLVKGVSLSRQVQGGREGVPYDGSRRKAISYERGIPVSHALPQAGLTVERRCAVIIFHPFTYYSSIIDSFFSSFIMCGAGARGQSTAGGNLKSSAGVSLGGLVFKAHRLLYHSA